ncbi:MAG: type II toxin-antitoxin system VapC family toxin, partial [Cyanobacteria bacterium P01_F01_bin.53]
SVYFSRFSVRTIVCESWLEELEQGIVVIMPDADDREPAIDVSITQQHSFQDCLYIAVAERLNIPLLSADKKQLDAATEHGISVKTLDDFQS